MSSINYRRQTDAGGERNAGRRRVIRKVRTTSFLGCLTMLRVVRQFCIESPSESEASFWQEPARCVY